MPGAVRSLHLQGRRWGAEHQRSWWSDGKEHQHAGHGIGSREKKSKRTGVGCSTRSGAFARVRRTRRQRANLPYGLTVEGPEGVVRHVELTEMQAPVTVASAEVQVGSGSDAQVARLITLWRKANLEELAGAVSASQWKQPGWHGKPRPGTDGAADMSTAPLSVEFGQ
jgi:hypothetical protein